MADTEGAGTGSAGRGLSKEAWAAITAVAVALISAGVTLATHFLPAPKSGDASAGGGAAGASVQGPSTAGAAPTGAAATGAASAVGAGTGTDGPATGGSPPPKTSDSPTADPIAGRWAGTATDASGGSFRVDVDIARGCALHARCGTIQVSGGPCRGSIWLEAVRDGDWEFRVAEFVAPSVASCTEGAGEHFAPGPGGTLVYTTSYDPRARALLTRRDGQPGG